MKKNLCKTCGRDLGSLLFSECGFCMGAYRPVDDWQPSDLLDFTDEEL